MEMKLIYLSLMVIVIFCGCFTTQEPVEPTPAPILTEEPLPLETPEELFTPAPEQKEFIVSEEVYEKTYNEIDGLIEEVTRLIRRHDFKGWRDYLAENYIIEKSDLEYLREISEAPAIKNRNKVLETLEDYFIYVVVPSRAKTKLEKIIFEDENHVKAYGTIFNKRGILYYLERIDGQWKIAIW